MTFSLPEPRPYPGYEIERFESEGGQCGTSNLGADKNGGMQENDATSRGESREASDRTEETCELRDVVPIVVLDLW